jgi:hypothetical protein
MARRCAARGIGEGVVARCICSSAWAAHNRLAGLGEEATDEKSNQIQAIPKLLSILALKGCIVTIDTMGCQRAIAEQVLDQEAD